MNRNKKWIVKRVLEYGLISDWNIIQSCYTISGIAEIAVKIRDLDDKSMSFIAVLSNTPKKNFLCNTTKQSAPPHWNF